MTNCLVSDSLPDLLRFLIAVNTKELLHRHDGHCIGPTTTPGSEGVKRDLWQKMWPGYYASKSIKLTQSSYECGTVLKKFELGDSCDKQHSALVANK